MMNETNIIVIGNGFDLAHELPTEYMDFLAFCKMIKALYNRTEDETKEVIWDNLGIKLKKQKNITRLKQKFLELHCVGTVGENDSSIKIYEPYDELYCMVKDNVWIEYFLKSPLYQKENWIDFESEISRVIQAIDDDIMHQNAEDSTVVSRISIPFLEKYLLDNYDERVQIRADKNPSMQEYAKNASEYEEAYPIEIEKEEITYKDLVEILELDLNRLNRALEIYLTEYVGKMECNLRSPDIEEIAVKRSGNSAIMSKVISFNYTDTYEKIYLPDKKLAEKYVDYIHGKAIVDNTVEDNALVLGIDEYLPSERKNKDTRFISFKKYYQRIYKETGCRYMEWVDAIKADYLDFLQRQEIVRSQKKLTYNSNLNTTLYDLEVKNLEKEKCSIHNLYIFGHSLDITDKDVLRELMLNDNVHTVIFYHDKQAMKQQIANLVKVIGQEELIKRTGGKAKTIEFRAQREMQEIKIDELNA